MSDVIKFGDLDDVALVREIERRFDIRLPNEEAARVRTVGDLMRQCFRMYRASNGARCRA